MKSPKPKWIEKAEETFRFHRSRLQTHDKWTIIQTSNSLDRSEGSIVEDLMLARWLRTHREQLEEFEYAKDALKFIRAEEKKRKIGLDE